MAFGLKSRLRMKIRRLLENRNSPTDTNYAFLSIVRKINDGKLKWLFRFFWSFILILSVLLCTALIYDRFAYYRSEPSIVNIYSREVNTVDFPSATLCTTTSPELTEFASKIDDGKIPETLSIACMEPLINYNQHASAKELWSMLNSSRVVDSIHFLQNPSENLKENLTYMLTPAGTCVLVTVDKQIQLSNPKMQLVFKFNETNLGNRCALPQLKFYLSSKGRLDITAKNDGALPSKYSVLSLASIQQYEFMNKTKRQCTLSEDFDLCEDDCTRKEMMKFNFSCRLPFMTDSVFDELPECGKNYFKVYMESTDSYLGIWKRNASTDTCKCTAPCKKEIISNRLIIEEKSGLTVRVKVIDSIKIAKEVPSYDLIAFFCDLGGNIGLTLGVSCLMIAEMIIILITLTRRNIKRFQKKRSSRSTFFENKVQKCLKKYERINEDDLANSFQLPGLQYILMRQNEGHVRKYLWIFLIIFSSFVCGFQIYDRIAYYLSYPKTVSIRMIAVEDIELPTYILCLESGKLILQKKKYMKQNGIPGCVDDFDMLNMVNDKVSVDVLWDWSRKGLNFMRVPESDIAQFTVVPITLENLSTVYGICTKVTPEITRYFPLYTGFYVTFLKSSWNCPVTTKMFPITPGNEFSLKTYLHIRDPGIYQIVYTMQKLIRLNTPKSPCMDKKEFTECLRACQDKRIQAQNYICKLPFMNSTLDTCKDAKSAKLVKSQYLSVMLNTDPIKDCKCPKSCVDPIYYPEMKLLMDYGSPANMLVVSVFHNFVEVIEEVLLFPFVKLLCDMGSNMGVVLGMSVMSFLHDTLHVLNLG